MQLEVASLQLLSQAELLMLLFVFLYPLMKQIFLYQLMKQIFLYQLMKQITNTVEVGNPLPLASRIICADL